VVILSALRLRVKILDLRGLDGGGANASLPSWGRRCGAPIILGLVSLFSVASFGFPCFLLLIFDLLCKRFSSPPCIGSAVVALFIKRGESLFRLLQLTKHYEKHTPLV
jgi:hypothetical protein